MMRHAKRTDNNHAQIREALRNAGYDVLDLSRCGNGVPDLSVRVSPFVAVLLEVKDGSKPPSAQKLTAAEQQWLEHWGHITRVVNSIDSAIAAVLEFEK